MLFSILWMMRQGWTNSDVFMNSSIFTISMNLIHFRVCLPVSSCELNDTNPQSMFQTVSHSSPLNLCMKPEIGAVLILTLTNINKNVDALMCSFLGAAATEQKGPYRPARTSKNHHFHNLHFAPSFNLFVHV